MPGEGAAQQDEDRTVVDEAVQEDDRGRSSPSAGGAGVPAGAVGVAPEGAGRGPGGGGGARRSPVMPVG